MQCAFCTAPASRFSLYSQDRCFRAVASTTSRPMTKARRRSGRMCGLERKLAEFETKTPGQLVVVTLKSLQGTSIEDYGYQLGRHWQIGQKEKNTGAAHRGAERTQGAHRGRLRLRGYAHR